MGWVFSMPRDEARDGEFTRRARVLQGWVFVIECDGEGLRSSRNGSARSVLVVEWTDREATGR